MAPIALHLIAAVDDTRHQSGGSIPPSRPIIYLPRDLVLLHRLRSSVVALRVQGAGAGEELSTPIYAIVRIYSCESLLFRKGSQYPSKLSSRVTGDPSQKSWEAVASNLLAWEIKQQYLHRRMAASLTPQGYSDDADVSLDGLDITLEAESIKDLGNATSITLGLPVKEAISSQSLRCGAEIAQALTGLVVSLHGWILHRSPYGTQSFKVVQISTTTGSSLPQVGIMSEKTVIRFTSAPDQHPSATPVPGAETRPPSNNDDATLIAKEQWIERVKSELGGYNDILEQIIDAFYGSLVNAMSDGNTGDEKADCYRLPFKGILLSGRPGTGKSRLASSLAKNSGLPYVVVNCPDIFQTDAGASEMCLQTAFSSLLSRSRASFLILDEVDMIASGRASRKGVEGRIFATLLHLVDSVNNHPKGNKIFIIALTNRRHAVDGSLTRSGRLERTFDLHLKGADQRLKVLEIVSKDLPIIPDQRLEILRRVAKAAHGYVPADLIALCTECALELISLNAKEGHGSENKFINYTNFERALKVIRPSGMGEFHTKIPSIRFNDLYGIDSAISDLRVAVIEPFENQAKYIEIGITPPRGILVHGPPGVGKTALCCALAQEMGVNFMLVEGSQIRSKVVGESEHNIARMFSQAKANAPCILFIDQIDILAPSRGSTHTSENTGDRIVTSLLTEMDGFFSGGRSKSVEVDVLVLAATNRPEVIDAAVMRPGRLDQKIYLPVPNIKTRRAILEGYMNKMPMRVSSEERQQLAESTEDYSGADLENICREAALISLRENIENTEITLSHVLTAKRITKPSLLGYKAPAPTLTLPAFDWHPSTKTVS